MEKPINKTIDTEKSKETPIVKKEEDKPVDKKEEDKVIAKTNTENKIVWNKIVKECNKINMNKYKVLHFGHCYLNRGGDLAVVLLNGKNKEHGYKFVGSSAHPNMVLREFWALSRVVNNDGNWIEISINEFNSVSKVHAAGYVVKLPAVFTGKESFAIEKFGFTLSSSSVA